MINGKYVGSSYAFVESKLNIFTKTQENMLNFSFTLQEVTANIFNLAKLYSLLPLKQYKPIPNSPGLTHDDDNSLVQSLDFLNFLSNYSFEIAIKVIFSIKIMIFFDCLKNIFIFFIFYIIFTIFLICLKILPIYIIFTIFI